jgi:ABC-type glycerol-3-phosphate transport system substrate-binding protein
VVLASPVLLASLWREKQIAPMSDLFPPSFIDSFAAVTLQGALQDGELWGLPDTAGFHLLLFYNRALIDRPPPDVESLLAEAQALTTDAAVSQWGLGVNSYDPLWVVPWLTPYGDWLTDSAGRPTLDTPAMAAALTLHKQWHTGPEADTGAIAPVATYEEMRTQFSQGDIAMIIDGAWAITELGSSQQLDWGVATLPSLVQAEESQPAVPLVLARYWGVARSATGNRALAAAAFLEYITHPERQLAWTAQFGLLPTRRQALDDSAIVNNPALRVSVEQMRTGRMVPLATNANAILDLMRQPLQGVIDGDLSPAEAAEMMQQAAGR